MAREGLGAGAGKFARICAATASRCGARHNSNETFQSLQADLFAAGERLTIARADAPPPVARPIADVIERRRKFSGPSGDELAFVTTDRLHLAFDRAADVGDERGPGVDFQMQAEKIQESGRPIRLPREVALRQFRPESRGLD